MTWRFFHIHRGTTCIPCWVKAGIGSFAAFAVALMLGDITGASMVVAPMGASAVLIYGLPESPVSQPAHVILGHLIAAVTCMLSNWYFPPGPWVTAGTIGVVIALLGLLHLTHPPAAATPMVVLLTRPNWMFLITPLMSGMVTLVLVAVLIHRLPPATVYPIPVPDEDDGANCERPAA